MAREGRFPCDIAVFADTGEEPAAVTRHLAWLQSLGTPPILVRSAGRLGDDMVHGRGPAKRFVSVPAFTLGDAGRVGRVPRQCTRDYKIDVVERAIRRDVLGLAPGRRCPPGVTVVQYFGISADEAGRAARAKTRFAEKKWTVPAYPLLDLGWTRRDCLTWLAGRTPHPAPGRRACSARSTTMPPGVTSVGTTPAGGRGRSRSTRPCGRTGRRAAGDSGSRSTSTAHAGR